MTGVYPKVVQQVMRHQSITLTMDTYGHLFPGQEADAVGQMRKMLFGLPEELRATGTDNATVEDRQNQRSARRSAQNAKRCVQDAEGCEERTKPAAQKKSSKPLQIADLGDGVRVDASSDTSSGGGTRTPDTRIMIPLL